MNKLIEKQGLFHCNGCRFLMTGRLIDLTAFNHCPNCGTGRKNFGVYSALELSTETKKKIGRPRKEEAA